jgi:phage terminase large subunit GpA-like protein
VIAATAWEETLDLAELAFWAGLAPPPPPRPLLEWCTMLRYPDGAMAGMHFDPKSHPPEYMVLRAVQAGGFHRYVVVGPTQDGKTWTTLIVPMLYVLTELRLPAIYGAPDMRLCQDTWTEKIKPALVRSGLGHFLPVDGIGSSGGTNVTTVHLHGGATLFFMGAGAKNESAQASRTVAYVFKDELDSIKPAMIPLMDRRADNYDDLARRFETSTIKDDRNSRVLARLRDSTNGRPWYACTACGRAQAFEWEQVRADYADDISAIETVRLHCRHCDHGMTDDERKQAIAGQWWEVREGESVDEHGTVVGTARRSLTYGLRWTALDSPLKSLAKLAVEFRAASIKAAAGDHTDLRNFHRDQLTQEYTGDLDQSVELTLERIYKLSAQSGYQAGEVPHGAEYLTMATDMQHRWCYWAVRGHDREGRRWLIAAGVESLRHEHGIRAGQALDSKDQPTKEQRWAALDRVAALVANGWRRGDEHFVPVRRGLDVGNYLDELRPWLARNLEWTACVGRGESQVLRQAGGHSGNRLIWIPGVVDVRQQQDAFGPWALWMVDADRVRGQIHDGLLAEPGAPGSGAVFRGIASKSATEWIARHLTAEMRVRDEASGEVRWDKRSADARNDILDACVYADALGKAHAEWLASQEPKPPPTPVPATPRRDRPTLTPAPRRHSMLDRRRT